MINLKKIYVSDGHNVVLKANESRLIVLFNGDSGSYCNIPNIEAVADALNGIEPNKQSKIDRIRAKAVDKMLHLDPMSDEHQRGGRDAIRSMIEIIDSIEAE